MIGWTSWTSGMHWMSSIVAASLATPPVAGPTLEAPPAEPVEPAPPAEGVEPAPPAVVDPPPAVQPSAPAEPTEASDPAPAPTSPSARASGPAYDPDSGVPPGGYWDPGTAPEIAPADGEDQILIGAILVPIGILTTVTAAVTMVFTAPSRCPEKLGSFADDVDEDTCRGLFVFNAVRTGYGAAMVVTGAVFLGIGLHRRRALRQWKARRFQAGVELEHRGVGLNFGGRF